MELQHHGVKGMKWGIRKKRELKGLVKGAKKDVDYKDYGDGRIEIKKSAQMQRLVGKHNKQDLAGMTYASFTTYDNNRYVQVIGGVTGGRNTKLTLEASTDLKSPSTKDAAKIFMKTLKDNPKLQEDYSGLLFTRDIKYSKKDFDDMLNGKNDKRLIDDYTSMNSQLMFGEADNIKSAYFKNLKANGYNMLRDENDVASGYSKSPVILLDGAESVKLKSKQIIDKDMRKDAKLYVKHYKKDGELWLSEHGFN